MRGFAKCAAAGTFVALAGIYMGAQAPATPARDAGPILAAARQALGARQNGVLGLVIRDGLKLVTVGLGIGLAGALALTRVLGQLLVQPQPSNGPLLFDIRPTDALTYAGVTAVLVLVAIAACLMPARRAASVDPMIALRAQ